MPSVMWWEKSAGVSRNETGKVPTSRKGCEKWGTQNKHLPAIYLNDLTADASSSFTSNTVYSLVI
jgi:hypothetical protein